MVLLYGVAVFDDSGLVLTLCQPQVAGVTATQHHRLHNSYTCALGDTAATVMRRAAVLAQRELITSRLHDLMHGGSAATYISCLPQVRAGIK